MKGLRGFGFFSTTLVMYLCLPLLGWGIDDLGGFFSLPQRLGYAVTIGLLGLGVGYQALDVPLGRLYSPEVTVQQDHRLVTTGLYRYIRHPRYLGAINLSLGLSLLFRSWVGLVVTFLFCGVFVSRIRDEEILMRKEFGEAWKAYCERSWRLIPFLY